VLRVYRFRLKGLKKTDIALALLIVSALTVSLLLLYTPVSSEEGVTAKLPETFTKTIYYLNKSTTYLQRSINGEDVEEIDIDVINNITNELERAVEIFEERKRLGNGALSSLDRELYYASIAYRDIAYSINYIVDSTNYLEDEYYVMKDILEKLIECRVDEALSEYYKIRDQLIVVRDKLAKAYNIISNVSDNDLLSKDHVDAKYEALDRIARAYNMVNEFIELMDSVDKNSDAVKNMCRYIHGQSSGLSSQDIGGLNQIAGSVDKNKLINNPLGSEESEFISMINSVLKDYMGRKNDNEGQNNIGRPFGPSPENPSNKPGSGAGYREAVEDD